MAYWKDIFDFPSYEITTLGRVYSHNQGRFLKTGITHGYHHVTLCKNNKKYTRRIHVLVLEQFVGLKPCGFEARHLDGNKNNNNLSNLKWGTKKENGQDKVKHGTSKVIKGERHGNSKLTEQDVIGIWKLWWNGMYTQQEIAKGYNIGQSVVSRIINNRAWKHIWR